MKVKKGYALGLVLLLLTGCGTADAMPKSETKKVVTGSDGSEWVVNRTVEDREIIAELNQTTQDTSKRDEKAAQTVENEDFINGLFGKPTADLAEELAIQGIESMAAIDAVEDIYGGYEGFEKEGVQFFEWKSGGAEQSGFWIGIKDPDKRLTELVQTLQKQVDEGEILAKYIYIFHSAFTQKEQYELTDQAAAAVGKMAKVHEKPDVVSSGVSVNTMTGVIEIDHNFLTEEQQATLRQQFLDHEIEFEQQGRLVPVGDEPDITYPTLKFVEAQSTEGSYIMSVTDNGMLVVDALATDYSGTGGEKEHFGAMNVTYQGANKKLEVGQKVAIEYSGSVMLSYPGQGTAKIVEVLPEYKPVNAMLSESQVIRKALEIANDTTGWGPGIRSIHFDEHTKVWKVTIHQGEKDYEIEVKDDIN